MPVYKNIKFVSAKNVVENGNSLEYTIKGDDIYSGELVNSDGEIEKVDFTGTEFARADEYPEYIFQNKIYFLKMYTTRAKMFIALIKKNGQK